MFPRLHVTLDRKCIALETRASQTPLPIGFQARGHRLQALEEVQEREAASHPCLLRFLPLVCFLLAIAKVTGLNSAFKVNLFHCNTFGSSLELGYKVSPNLRKCSTPKSELKTENKKGESLLSGPPYPKNEAVVLDLRFKKKFCFFNHKKAFFRGNLTRK